MITVLIGILLGLAVGAGCRWVDIPVPSPPSIPGALFDLAMTLGYLGADIALTHTATSTPPTPVTSHATP